MAYYLKNEEHNGIEIYFGNKPSSEIIADLKAHHWRWHPSKNCWYHRYTEANEALAKMYCDDQQATPIPVEEKKESKEETPKQEAPYSVPVAAPSIPTPAAQYPTTKYRLAEDMICRDLTAEKEFGISDLKIYGYWEDKDTLYIVGEIFCSKKPSDSFCMVCTIYDKDGDIIETTESRSYGSGLVTSMITPAAFFDGFPFAFNFWSVPRRRIKEISITPASSY